MKILTQKMKLKDLQAGDVFSTESSDYWDNFEKRPDIAEQMWLRTETPCPKVPENDIVYKLTILM